MVHDEQYVIMNIVGKSLNDKYVDLPCNDKCG
jgi:hypothetical protein